MGLQFLDELEDIVQVKRLNPMLMSNMVHLYQEGKYEAVITALRQYVEETKSIDVYLLFMGYSADLFLAFKTLPDVADCLNSYQAQLFHLSNKLSPIELFDTTLTKALDVVMRMLDMKLSAELKQLKVFNVLHLEEAYQNFLRCVQSITTIELNLPSRKSVIAVQKVIKKINVSIERLQDKEKSQEKKQDQVVKSVDEAAI